MNARFANWAHVASLIGLTVAAHASCADPLALPAHHHETVVAAPMPGESLYQLRIILETATGTTVPLEYFRGGPLLITMFYTHCTSVCPMLTADLKRLDAALSPHQRSKLRVLMVSLDGPRDTPAELTHFVNEHGIADPRWIVARASADDVRLLAATLGIRYRELPDHSFNHSAIITLVDKDGLLRARTTDLLRMDEDFARALTASLGP